MIQIELKLLVIAILLLLSLISDLATYKIRNIITYSFMIAGIASNYIMEGLKGMVFSIQGIMLPVGCLIILYMIGILGAGDIKLLSAIGAVMGAGFAAYAMVCSFICGGIIAALLILIRRNGIERLKYLLTYIKSCLTAIAVLEYAELKDMGDGSKFHFSIAVASGTAVAVFVSSLGL